MLSGFNHVLLFATLWTIVPQGPLYMGFSRQEYWTGLSFPSPGDLPDPGIEPVSLTAPALADGFFTTVTTWVDFPGGSESKESACNADLSSVPGSGRAPGEGHGNPL